jgi:hypothetical protein
MDLVPTQTPFGEPSPSVADDEVEQLLQRAESLVEEIGDDARGPDTASTETPPADESLMKAGPGADISLDSQPPDALQALDATSEITRELSEILDQSPTCSELGRKCRWTSQR